jgi:hypothetical protein
LNSIFSIRCIPPLFLFPGLHTLVESARAELRRQEGAGMEVRIEKVPFSSNKSTGVEQKFSAISTILRFTGLGGRADGQFS